jgi:uncharacterized protein DUF6285
MLNAPDATELLAIARETVLKTIVVDLPMEKLYPALMIANAMAIAGREAAQAGALLDVELRDLEVFYGDAADAAARPEDRLLGLNRRLADDARAGRFEGTVEAAGFRALLERQVRMRLRISNPRYPDRWAL